MTEPSVPSESPTPEPSPQAPPSPPPPTVHWEAPSEPVGPAPGVEFAGHGPRLVAYILDSILLTVLITALFLVTTVVFLSGATNIEDPETVTISPAAASGAAILFLLIIVISILYFPFFWARGGQTPGMRPFSLRVVRDLDGGGFGWGTALLRLVGMYVAALVFYLGFIWIFVDKRRRGWHDLIAGTVVIKRA